MRRLSLPALLLTLLATACAGSGSSPTTPVVPEAAALPSAADSPVAITADGNALSVLGYAHVTINPDLTADFTPPREVAGQADQTRLSARPYLGPGEMVLKSVRRGMIGSEPATILTVSFNHPFDTPPDLSGPSTGVKRVDLHVFKPIAVALMDGTDTFTLGADAVTANARRVINASGYIKPGGMLVTPTGFNANTFPYVHITPLDAAAATTTYDPLGFGWQNADLLNPTGFGVFAQGSSHDVEIALRLEAGESIAFTLAMMAEYQQPKRNIGLDKPRLPDPLDPTRLLYFLPAGAGDNSSVTCEFPDATANNLPAGSSSPSTRMVVKIVDWDNQAPISAAWPNTADLGEVPEASGTDSVQVVIPGVMNMTPIVATSGGSGWSDDPVTYEINLSNTLLNAVPGTYYGLARVQDLQTGLGIVDLEEIEDSPGHFIPGSNPLNPLTDTVTYQAFSVVLENAVCSEYSASIQTGTGGFTLANGDTMRIEFNAINPGNWIWDPQNFSASFMSGDTDLTAAILSGIGTAATPASTTTVVHNDRNPVSSFLQVTVDVTKDTANSICVMNIPYDISPNVAPTCPSSFTVTDSTGGSIQEGEFVRANFSGIVDPDNSLATEVAVTVTYDYDGTGGPEDTKSGYAGDASLTSTVAVPVGATTITCTIAVSDIAGPTLSPCTNATAPVITGCGLDVGDIQLGSLITGNIERTAAANNGTLVGTRVKWTDVAGEAEYAIYASLWPTGGAFPSTFTLLGVAPANSTSFDHIATTAALPWTGSAVGLNSGGSRYVYRVNARCALGGPDGADSEFAVATLHTLQNLDLGLYLYNSTPGTNQFGGGWGFVGSELGTGVTGPSTYAAGNIMNGTPSLYVQSISYSLSGVPPPRFGAFYSPSIPAADLASLGPLSTSRVEFVHQVGNWMLVFAADAGMTVLSGITTPPAHPTTNPAPGSWQLRWGAAPVAAGFAYTDTTPSPITGRLPGIVGGAPGGASNWGSNGTPISFTRTYSAVNLPGTLAPSYDPYFCFAFCGASNITQYYLDDVAWLVY